MDEAEAGSVAFGRQFDLDGGRARRHTFLVFPAPGEDEPMRWVELDVLAARRMSRDDLAEVDAAGARVELGRHAFPANELLRVDEELPDRLRAGRDRQRTVVHGGLSRCVHASFAPPFPLRVSVSRAGRPRTPRGSP